MMNDKQSQGDILRKLLNDPIELGIKPTPLKRISKLQQESIDGWLAKNEKGMCLILYPDPNRVGYQSFSNMEWDKFDSTEFRCAMRYLDDLGVPRADDDGQEYSIVGRIKYLANEGH